MPKNNFLLCRGASITHIDQRVAEGNCFVRVHVQCDLTEQIVEKMGWESALDDGKLSEAVEKLELSGELNIDQISFTVNGQSAPGLECVATRAEQFKVSRIKGETEGVKVTVLRFLVISTAWKLFGEFFGELSAIDGAPRSANVTALTKVVICVAGAPLFRLAGDTQRTAVETARRAIAEVDAATVLAMQAAVETVTVDPAISRYCVDLTAATRTHPHVLMGASPRGALALLLTSRAFAVIAGRDYVTPEDVKAVAPAVLAHRITVRPELWMSNASGGSVAAAVLTTVPTPSPGGAGPTA